MKIVLNIEVDKIEKDDLEELKAFAKKLNEKKESRPPRVSFLNDFINNNNKQRN